MAFQNPWGKGSDQHDKWFKNPWGEGGEYFKKLFDHSDKKEEDSSLADSATKKKVALAFWGGARSVGDNGAFSKSAINTQNSYGKIYTNSKHFATDARFVVNKINDQSDDSIGRLDLLTHASATACYMVRNETTGESGLRTTIPEDEVESNNLYTGGFASGLEGWSNGSDKMTIDEIKYSKFVNDAVIELHGCKVATTPYEMIIDNIAENMSEELYSADKKRAVVIGKAESANPRINGEKTTEADQDYRHGKRVAFHNGAQLFSTTRKGHIGKDAILVFINKKESNPDTYDGKNEVYK